MDNDAVFRPYTTPDEELRRRRRLEVELEERRQAARKERDRA